MKQITYILATLTLLISPAFSQTETVGLLTPPENSGVDYVLFNPEKSTSSYLINSCGEVVNQWTFNSRPGITAYILENGNILQSGRDGLEIRNWDNDLLWTFDLNTLGYNKHHDIEPLPNGNILVLVHDEYDPADMIAIGKDPSTIGASFKLDKIIEVEPSGTDMANIVWEWKFIEHIVQDFDVSKPNFGVVADHPELLDFNHTLSHQTDFTHVNGIDYHEGLDQILISARHTNEIYIIDHSTSTLEASGHTGGTYEKGGDLLWRFGNVAAYDAGTVADQKLRLQHDAKWIKNVNPSENNISVFNNESDGTPNQSSVHKIAPLDSMGFYKFENGSFLANDFTDTWTGSTQGEVVFEGKKSGVQVLSNGNYLITETSKGKLSEVNNADGVIWTYVNPVGEGLIHDQFTTIIPNSSKNTLFRGENYNADFPGFIGKDMTGNGIIENENGNSDGCTLGTNELTSNAKLEILNSVNQGTVFLSEHFKGKANLYSLSGQLVSTIVIGSSNTFTISANPGFYLVELVDNNQTVLNEKILIK